MSSLYQYCPSCGEKLIHKKDHESISRLSCMKEGCGFRLYENPTPVAAVIVEYETKILLARNAAWSEGWYALITGFVEKHELPEACARREVKEELNLEVKELNFVGHYSFEMKNQLIIAYHAIAEGEIKLSPELVDYKLLEKSDIKPWPYATGDAIRDWLISKGYKPII